MKKTAKFFVLISVFIVTTVSSPHTASAVMVDQMVPYCPEASPKRILAGETYSQKFISETNEFGIVAVKFTNYLDISDDSLVFRIKEKNSKDWYFEYTYKVDQMQNDEFFTFGIPPITNALGKEYVFELESLSGKPDNSIGVYVCEESGDLVFKLVQGVSAFEQLKNDIFFQINSDIGFFLLWLLLTTAFLIKIVKHSEKNT